MKVKGSDDFECRNIVSRTLTPPGNPLFGFLYSFKLCSALDSALVIGGYRPTGIGLRHDTG